MASVVIDDAAVSGLLWNITMAVLLTALELLATALIVAPKAVTRKLASALRAALRAALRRLGRALPAAPSQRSPADTSGGGAP
jgi:hypothetical protein